MELKDHERKLMIKHATAAVRRTCRARGPRSALLHYRGSRARMPPSSTTDPFPVLRQLFVRRRSLCAPLAAALALAGSLSSPAVPARAAAAPSARSAATGAEFRSASWSAHHFPSWAQGAIVYGAALPLDGPHGLRAVRRRLPQIAALGATVLWLSPVTGAPAGDFGYAVTDALHVRASLGTEADLRELVRAAHALGMRVILDMVVNHLSDQHPYAVDARRRGKASPYYDWFERDAQGRVMHYFDWSHLDNLDYGDPAVQRYEIGAFVHWVRDAGIDGFRVDASWAVRERAPGFWPRWRAALDRADPDLLLIAEGSATDPYYLAHGFGADYDWTSRIGEWAWSGVFDRDAARADPPGASAGRAISASNSGGRAASVPDLARLRAALLEAGRPGRVLRFIDDNDTGARFITRHGLAETKLAATMLLTLPGLPLIYDGEETGAEYDPYGGRPILRQDRYGLRALYARLGALRRAWPALRADGIRLVATDHDDTVLAYLRPGPPSAPQDGVLVLLNWGAVAADVRLAEEPAMNALAAGGTAVDLLSGAAVHLSRDVAPRGTLTLTLPAHGALALAFRRARVP